MGIFGRISQVALGRRQRQLAKDLSIVWQGLVSTAPASASLGMIVEQYGFRIPIILHRNYQDILDASQRPGQEYLIHRIAMEGILHAQTHSGKDLEEIRGHMGTK